MIIAAVDNTNPNDIMIPKIKYCRLLNFSVVKKSVVSNNRKKRNAVIEQIRITCFLVGVFIHVFIVNSLMIFIIYFVKLKV